MSLKVLQSKLKSLKDSYDVKVNEYLNEDTSIERKEVLDNEIEIIKNEIEILQYEIEIESKKDEITELNNTLETESNLIMKQITRYKIKILEANIRQYKFPNDPSISKLILYYYEEIKKLGNYYC